MTKKERIIKTIKHEKTDIVPYNIGFTIPTYQKLVEYYKGVIPDIGNHLAVIEAKTADAWKEIKPGFFQDEFGVVWNRTIDPDIGNPEIVLHEPTLKGYKFPDPYKPGRFDKFNEFIEKNSEYYILCSIGFSLFERAWTLRGMENLLCDMITNPGFVEDLLDGILEYNMGIIEQAVKFPIDGFMFGDDWGQQRGMIMGPKLWRKFIKPRIAKMYAKVKESGKTVFIHSCGDVVEIFPELIEIGLDVFNPFQPEVMDVYEIKKKYGDKLTFYGGISTQRLLPYGTPDEVRREVRRMIDEIGSQGGYILAPAHAIPKDVPVENIIALIETVQNQ